MPLSYASAAYTHSTTEVDAELHVKRTATEVVEGVKEETEDIAKKLIATGDTPKPSGDTPKPAGAKEPTLCIARLPTQMSSDGVVMSIVGTELGYGKVEKVDMIQKTDHNGIDYMMAFVHFAEWTNSEAVKADREKLMNGEKIKVVYDEENNRYFTLTRSYTKSREERNLGRGARGPRYGSAHGRKENQFKTRNKQRKA